MSEFKNRNDYSVSVFSGTEFLVKSSFVQSPYLYAIWLEKSKYNNWKYINVYARRTGRYLGRFYKGNFIPHKPN